MVDFSLALGSPEKSFLLFNLFECLPSCDLFRIISHIMSAALFYDACVMCRHRSILMPCGGSLKERLQFLFKELRAAPSVQKHNDKADRSYQFWTIRNVA